MCMDDPLKVLLQCVICNPSEKSIAGMFLAICQLVTQNSDFAQSDAVEASEIYRALLKLYIQTSI